MKTKLNLGSFAPTVLAHDIILTNGDALCVWVSPTETLGKALARMGVSLDSVASFAHAGPSWYEADLSVASK